MTKEYFINLFEYNDWANKESLKSLAQMQSPDEKVSDIFSHIMISQILWLSRLKKELFLYKTFWEKLPLSDANSLSEKSTKDWLSFIGDKTDKDFDIKYAYKNSRGEAFSNELQDILIHVINHSSYHRGQIAILVRKSGGTPAMTDYIHYKRSAPK
jgi:uncharacterized damage-inducible protein DinB